MKVRLTRNPPSLQWISYRERSQDEQEKFQADIHSAVVISERSLPGEDTDLIDAVCLHSGVYQLRYELALQVLRITNSEQ
jgi:hypothetical protein